MIIVTELGLLITPYPFLNCTGGIFMEIINISDKAAFDQLVKESTETGHG